MSTTAGMAPGEVLTIRNRGRRGSDLSDHDLEGDLLGRFHEGEAYGNRRGALRHTRAGPDQPR